MAKQMKKIAVDVDGVLLDLFGPFVEFYNLKHRTNYKIESIFSYRLHEVFQASSETVQSEMDLFYNSDLFRNIPLIDGSQNAIKLLSRNNTLGVVTARSDSLSKQTIFSLSKHFPGLFSDVHFTNEHKKDSKIRTKSEICVKEGYNVIIEDVADYANDCAEKGVKAFLLTRPWNISEKLHSDVIRVNNWNEIVRMLQ